MKVLKRKELKEYRENKLKENDYRCLICNRKIDLNEAVVDHIHGSHKSIYPETNKLVRGVICSDCNILLGKIENQFLRSSKKYKENNKLPDILRKMADYIEKYQNLDNFDEILIHPTEYKEKIIKRSSFNKFKKIIKEKFNKELNYPKSGKLTKEIKIYADKINFEFEYY
jgi:hypothetical protein